jgi:hypothetical protein
MQPIGVSVAATLSLHGGAELATFRQCLLLLSWTAGCGYISDDELNSRFDQDGDGFDATAYGGKDCDDSNRDVHPDAIEFCDGIDNDCDGDADSNALDLRTWYRDADEDGYGSPSTEVPLLSCFPPDGYVGDATDCNDDITQDGAAINPRTEWYRDEDGDGYGDPYNIVTTCIQIPGLVAPSDNDRDDCDDSDPTLNPDTEWWKDADGDGFGDPSTVDYQCWVPADIPDGWLRGEDEAPDCDDTEATVKPGAASAEPTLCTQDLDQDGYGTDSPSSPDHDAGTDCDDDNHEVSPMATELWWDEVQNNCSTPINTVSISSADISRPGSNLGDTLGKAVAGIGFFSQCYPGHASCTDVGQKPEFAISAPGESSLSASNGALYLINNPSSDTSVFATFHGSSDINRLGIKISGAGDLNDDGFDDVIVGTQDDYAYVLYGDRTGDGARFSSLGRDHSSIHVTVYVAESEGDQLGFGIASIGHFTGDGTPDIALGAYAASPRGDASGHVYIFPDADYHSTVNLNEIKTGWDGTMSTDTGGAWSDFEEPDTGAGGVETTTPPPIWVVEPQEGSTALHFGWDIAGLGDFNGDGADDMVIGAPGADFILDDAGRVYLMLGSPEADAGEAGSEASGDTGGAHDTPSTTIRTEPGFSHSIYADDLVWVDGKFEGDRLGATVGRAGDVDGDGLNDLTLSAVGTATSPTPGRVYVWFGANGDVGEDGGVAVDSAADLIIEPDDALGPGNFGFAVDSAGPTLHVPEGSAPGDLNGDGFGDLLIGSPEVADPGYDAGRVYLVYGGSDLVGTWEITDLVGASASSERRTGAVFTGESPYQLGYSVAGPGDLDGDDMSDLLLGAPGADLTATGAGATFFFSGPEAR